MFLSKNINYLSCDFVVLEYDRIISHPSALRSRVGISATVCGGLPVVDLLSTELLTGTVSKVRKLTGILNGTSNYYMFSKLQTFLKRFQI